MLRDSQGFETQIIDAVRSVNRALGGATGSNALRRSDYNQYEVQLIDAIRSIGRTLSGKGLSVAGGFAGDLSGYATVEQFQDLSRRVTKLEDESFFRLVDGNVTLKEEYRNLWVPGWMAAGGIGSGGGGGGGSSYLKEMLDVYHNGNGILRADGTAVVAGDALVYNSTLGWVAAPVSGGGGSSVVVTQSTASGVQTTTITVDGVPTSIPVTAVSFGTQASDKIPITIGATTKNVLTSHQSLSGYVPTSRQVNGHPLTADVTVTKGDLGLGNVENTKLSTWAGSQNITTLGTISTGVWNGTAIGVTKGGTGLTSIAKGAILYASANNVLSALAPNGTSTKKFLSQTGSNAPGWGTLSTSDITNIETWISGKAFATQSALDALSGTVDSLSSGLSSLSGRVDGLESDLSSLSSRVTSIEGWFEVVTVNGQSALHAKNNYAIYSDSWVASGGVGSGQGSGGASTLAQLLDVSLSTLADGDLLMYTASTTKWSNMRKANYLSGYATESWVNQQGFLKTETDPTVPSWAKAESKPSYSLSEISGTEDLRAIEALTGTGLLKRTGTNAWSLDTTAYLSAHQSVTLASGTNNGTLKLTTAAGTVDNIAVKGLGSLAYKSSLATADIPDISGTYVTLSGAQTITGAKTFSATITMIGANIFPSASHTCNIGASSAFFAGLYGDTVHAHAFELYSSGSVQAFRLQGGIENAGTANEVYYALLTLHQGTGEGLYITKDTMFGMGTAKDLGKTYARWKGIYGASADLTGNLDLGGVLRVNSLNTIDQSNASMSLFNFGARATKSFNAYGTGINFRACDSNGGQVNILAINATKIQAGSDIIPNYTAGLNLGGSSSTTRWATIYGVDANLSGDLSMAQTSHIDIGPIRIEYDSTNKGLHITKKDPNDTTKYGIYADGFNSAGGAGQNS